VFDLDALSGLLLSRNHGIMLPAQSEKREQCVINNDPTALFSEALERRARGERLVIGSSGVKP